MKSIPAINEEHERICSGLIQREKQEGFASGEH